MSEQNIARKLKKEAAGRARDKGHEITRFHGKSGYYVAECWKCREGVLIQTALESGVHSVDGKILTERCKKEFDPLDP